MENSITKQASVQRFQITYGNELYYTTHRV